MPPKNVPKKVAESQPSEVDNRRTRTKVRDEMEQYFKENDIEEGSPILQDKMPPGKVGKATVKFETNCYGVVVDKFPVYLYHMEINAEKPNKPKKPVFLTKRSSDDVIASDRRTRCRETFQILGQHFHQNFDPTITYYYDLQATLMATGKLKGNNPSEIVLSFDPKSFPAFQSLQSFSKIDILIKMAATEDVLTSDDMSMARLDDLTKFDRAHQRFIELATSKFSLEHPDEVACLAHGKMYLLHPEKTMNSTLVKQCNSLSSDKFLGIGLKKSAKYIEGPPGRDHANIALFLSPIKTPFFKSQTILEFLEGRQFRVNEARLKVPMQNAIKGLYVYNFKLPGVKRTFAVTGLSDKTARTSTFVMKDSGKTFSVYSYFKDKYNVTLKYPDAPLVKGLGKTDLLPMEMAKIDNMQPVPKNKMSQREDADMVKFAAQPPVIQKQEVKGFLGALGLNGLNKERDGMQIRSHLTCTGRVLDNPEIVYAGNKAVVPNENGLWNLPAPYLRAGGVEKWGLIKYGSDQVDMRGFQQHYVKHCKKMGIHIADIPVLIGTVNEKGLRHWFDGAKHFGAKFLVVVSDANIDMQGELKVLERKYDVTTQNVTSRVAKDVATGRGTATLENIVHKSNPKLGGTNYSIRTNHRFIEEAFGRGCLVIGIALSHQGSVDDVQRKRGGTSQTEALSAVGYAANTGVDPFEFIGDSLPNNAYRSEIVDLIPGIIRTTIEKFKDNRKILPTSMILYLNGSSEGDFVLLTRFEIPLVYKTMEDIIQKRVPLTVIVPQRSNVARIYKQTPNAADKPIQQNIQPGTCIDQYLVHPKMNEFYLNSHATIQGTARTPKYNIIHNDNEKATMDAIEHMTYYLSFAHQIINSPTSLPSPVYVAQAYAERGSKMYKVLPKLGLSTNPDDIVADFIYDRSEFFRNKRINA